MENRAFLVAVAGSIIGVQLALFVWLRADVESVRLDVGALGQRMDRAEREAAFLRGRLSLALPSLAHTRAPAAKTAIADLISARPCSAKRGHGRDGGPSAAWGGRGFGKRSAPLRASAA